MKAKNMGLVALGGLIGIVLLQNTQVVSVRFLFWKLSMSQIILLPLVLGAGIVIGIVMGKRSKSK